jgi:hypothetical protein
MNPVSSKLIFT